MDRAAGSLEITEGSGGVTITAPAARNRAFLALGFGFALPWIAVFFAGSIGAAVLAAPGQRRFVVLGALWLNLLVALIHILAVCLLWLGLYAWRGVEVVTLDAERFIVARRALGIRIPFKFSRRPKDGVRVLGPTEHGPGRGPHPRLEWRAGSSAVRFGAGLSGEQAETVAVVLEEYARRRSTGADGVEQEDD